MEKEGRPVITEILDYLNESPNTYITSRRIKKKLEPSIRPKDSANAWDYGKRLGYMRKMGLVEKNERERSGWKITGRGQKWVNNELDLREL